MKFSITKYQTTTFTPKSWMGWLSLVAIMLCLQTWQSELPLSYSRNELSTGEIWRAITAHFIHLNWTHAGLNIAGLTLCGLINPTIFRAKLIIQLLFFSIGISLMLWLFSPQVDNYIGFSGVLYGLFLIALWPLKEDFFSLLMMISITAWAFWQWIFGAPIAEQKMIGGQIISIAHLYGLGLAATWITTEIFLKKY